MTGREFVAGFKDYPHGVAWPGGYPVALFMSDGEACCPTCAEKEAWLIFYATRERSKCGWAAMAWGVHWEGEPLICCNCCNQIPSAYGSIEGQAK